MWSHNRKFKIIVKCKVTKYRAYFTIYYMIQFKIKVKWSEKQAMEEVEKNRHELPSKSHIFTLKLCWVLQKTQLFLQCFTIKIKGKW